jgi:hypothetical protein
LTLFRPQNEKVIARPNPLLSTARATQAELDLLLKMTPLEGAPPPALARLTLLRIRDVVNLGIETGKHLHSDLRHTAGAPGQLLLPCLPSFPLPQGIHVYTRVNCPLDVHLAVGIGDRKKRKPESMAFVVMGSLSPPP